MKQLEKNTKIVVVLYIKDREYNSKIKIIKTVGNITTLSYFTGAGLSLFSPPPLTNKKYKGLNSIKAHKYLASIHFSAMVATGIFKNRNKKIHKYSAYTAVGSFAAAMLVFKFE